MVYDTPVDKTDKNSSQIGLRKKITNCFKQSGKN